MASAETFVSANVAGGTLLARRRSFRLPPLGVVLPGATLLLIFCACFLWPLVASLPEPVGGVVTEARWPLLSPGHLLGTDLNGNDVWSRLLHGGRASLGIAVAVNVLGFIVGGFCGAFGAYVGGVVDSLIMRILDVLIAFPSLVLIVAVAQMGGAGQLNTIWALSFFSVPAFARIGRAATLRVREEPFIMAANLCGTGTCRVLLWHVLPNILPQLATFGLLGLGVSLVLEGALSFLGLGVPPPHPSWGNMIAHGQQALLGDATLVLLPSACIFATVLSCNLLSEKLLEGKR